MKVNLLKQVSPCSPFDLGFCEVLSGSSRLQHGITHRTNSFCANCVHRALWGSVGLLLVDQSMFPFLSGVLRVNYPEYCFQISLGLLRGSCFVSSNSLNSLKVTISEFVSLGIVLTTTV